MVTRKFTVSKAGLNSAIAARAARPADPGAIAKAAYRTAHKTIELTLGNGTTLAIPVSKIAELASARPADLKALRLTPAHDALILDKADAHISVQGLIRDFFFTALPAPFLAGHLASRGGRKSSEAKKTASAENGRKGGRPRKLVTPNHAHAKGKP